MQWGERVPRWVRRVPRWGEWVRWEGALEQATGRKQGKGIPSGMGDDKVSIMRRQAPAATSNHNHHPLPIT